MAQINSWRFQTMTHHAQPNLVLRWNIAFELWVIGIAIFHQLPTVVSDVWFPCPPIPITTVLGDFSYHSAHANKGQRRHLKRASWIKILVFPWWRWPLFYPGMAKYLVCLIIILIRNGCSSNCNNLNLWMLDFLSHPLSWCMTVFLVISTILWGKTMMMGSYCWDLELWEVISNVGIWWRVVENQTTSLA